MVFQRLPLELLEHIFHYLDWRSLVLCRQVHSTFRTLIDSGANLQYIIELGGAHQEDGPPSTLGPSTRLDMLREHQFNWATLNIKSDRQIPMADGGLWELYGNVLAQNIQDNSYKFIQLPSHSRNIEEKQWLLEDLDIEARDFGLDYSQDLFVLAEKVQTDAQRTDFRIHLRTLSTGRPHPLAQQPAYLTHSNDAENLPVSLTIQVSEVHVAILFHFLLEDPERQLLIWNWKTGERKTFLTGDAIRSFSFLSDRYIIIVTLQEDASRSAVDPSMKIWDLQSATDEPVDIKEANFCRSFEFPELHERAIPIEITIRSDPSPQWKPSDDMRVPFHQARGARLYVVTFWVIVGNVVRGINVFTHLTTLLHHVTSNSASTEVRWDEWGPHGSRLLKSWHHPSSVWVCYVCGEKYVAVLPSESDYVLCVFDFNETLFRRDSLRRPGRSINDKTVYRKREGVFQEDVTTSLPHRVVFTSVGTDLLHGMCSEDAIVLVNTSQRYYRILTF